MQRNVAQNCKNCSKQINLTIRDITLKKKEI